MDDVLVQIKPSGTYYYDENDLFHREDGPAIEWYGGGGSWFIHGKLHRIGSPAVIYSTGEECWFKDGLKHRVDGPAVNYHEEESWWVNGKEIDIKPILERLDISPDWQNWTDEEKFLVRLALP